MEENPLKRRRGHKSTIGSQSPEELLIETTFRNFDYGEKTAAREREQGQEERLLRGAQDVESERNGEPAPPSGAAEGETNELVVSCSKLSLRSELLINEHAPDTDEDGGEDASGSRGDHI